MPRKRYPSDLIDAARERIASLIPPAKRGGHPHGVDMREGFDGIFQVACEGNSWRGIPYALSYFGVCSWHHRRLQGDDTWEALSFDSCPRVITGLCVEVKRLTQRSVPAYYCIVRGPVMLDLYLLSCYSMSAHRRQ